MFMTSLVAGAAGVAGFAAEGCAAFLVLLAEGVCCCFASKAAGVVLGVLLGGAGVMLTVLCSGRGRYFSSSVAKGGSLQDEDVLRSPAKEPILYNQSGATLCSMLQHYNAQNMVCTPWHLERPESALHGLWGTVAWVGLLLLPISFALTMEDAAEGSIAAWILARVLFEILPS